MLEDIKNVLRITSNAFDTEITDLIQSAADDLQISGVFAGSDISSGANNLIKRAVILYCKANFGLDNADSEKYQKAYDSLKIHLSLSQDYKLPEVT